MISRIECTMHEVSSDICALPPDNQVVWRYALLSLQQTLLMDVYSRTSPCHWPKHAQLYWPKMSWRQNFQWAEQEILEGLEWHWTPAATSFDTFNLHVYGFSSDEKCNSLERPLAGQEAKSRRQEAVPKASAKSQENSSGHRALAGMNCGNEVPQHSCQQPEVFWLVTVPHTMHARRQASRISCWP